MRHLFRPTTYYMSSSGDSMLRKKLDEAMGKALGTKMRACMEAAEDDAAKDQCVVASKEAHT